MEFVVDATPEQCTAALWDYFRKEWPYKGQVSRGDNRVVFVEEDTVFRDLFRNFGKQSVSVSAVVEHDGRTHLYVIAKDRRYARTLETWIREELPTQAAAMKPSPDTSPAAPSTTDIPEQIKKLAELRDSGAITNEEFERKKAELLDRM